MCSPCSVNVQGGIVVKEHSYLPSCWSFLLKQHNSYVMSILITSLHRLASEMLTLLASDRTATESFRMKCQQSILGITWHYFVRNSKISSCTSTAKCPNGLEGTGMPYSYMWKGWWQTTHTGLCYIKSSSQLVDLPTPLRNINQLDRPALPWQLHCPHHDHV